ncbi:hypothetical protein K466DRAFT_569124 [Polyporus arcularius HHB13444]|uniref:Uncharacterized protein n=1 Tax=Polyporus arcularius HHB13444 TaxID=1314778 RepID=A0A5C3NVG7_9APHY|nr:hypothetical protein K466DRAFT_569124 [Polyporus arcularius HHB13444]
MCHGRTALVEDHIVRDNTNSAKWRLTHTTYNMIAYAAAVVLYLVSGKSAFIRGDWEDTYQEYYRKLLDSQHSRGTTELLEQLNDYIFGANAKVSLKDLKDPLRDHGWARLRDDDSDGEEHQARLSTARASPRHGSSPLAAHEQSYDPVCQVLSWEELDSIRQQDSFLQDGQVFQDNHDIAPQDPISLTDSDDEDGFIVHNGTPRLVLSHNDTQAAADWPHEDDYYPVGLALHESPILDKNGRFRVRFAETPGNETDAGHQGDQEQADNPGATSGEDRGAETDSEEDEVSAIWPHAVISSTNAHVARLSANAPPVTSNAPSFSDALSFATPQACSTPAAFINFAPSDFVPGEPSPFAPLRDTAAQSTRPPSKAKPSKSAAAAGKRPSAKSAATKQASPANAPKSTTGAAARRSTYTAPKQAALPNSPFLLPSTPRRRMAAQSARSQAAQQSQVHQASLCQIEETPEVALQTRAPTAPAPQPATTPVPQPATTPVPQPATTPSPLAAAVPPLAPAHAPAPVPVPARVPAPVPVPARAPAPVPVPAPAPAPVLAPAPAPGQKPKPRPRPKGKDLAMTEATSSSKSAPETTSGTPSCPGSVVISATLPTGRVEISARSNSNGAAASGSSTMGEVAVSASVSGNVVASVGASIVQDGLSEPQAEAFAEVS